MSLQVDPLYFTMVFATFNEEDIAEWKVDKATTMARICLKGHRNECCAKKKNWPGCQGFVFPFFQN